MKTKRVHFLICSLLIAAMMIYCAGTGFASVQPISKTAAVEPISTDMAKETGGRIYARPQSAGALLALAGSGAALRDTKGIEVKASDPIASGMELIKADGTVLPVIIKGDINGDGKITAADARAALRFAVALDTPNAWQRDAAKIIASPGNTAADARVILRTAVGLSRVPLYEPLKIAVRP